MNYRLHVCVSWIWFKSCSEFIILIVRARLDFFIRSRAENKYFQKPKTRKKKVPVMAKYFGMSCYAKKTPTTVMRSSTSRLNIVIPVVENNMRPPLAISTPKFRCAAVVSSSWFIMPYASCSGLSRFSSWGILSRSSRQFSMCSCSLCGWVGIPEPQSYGDRSQNNDRGSAPIGLQASFHKGEKDRL